MSFGPFPNDPGLGSSQVAKASLANAIQNIPGQNTASIKILLDTIDPNDNGVGKWDFVNHQWICGRSGWYAITGGIFATILSANSEVYAAIAQNGAGNIIGTLFYSTVANQLAALTAYGLVYLNAGDDITLLFATIGTPGSGAAIVNDSFTFMSIVPA
jgi:hypothetical protein